MLLCLSVVVPCIWPLHWLFWLFCVIWKFKAALHGAPRPNHFIVWHKKRSTIQVADVHQRDKWLTLVIPNRYSNHQFWVHARGPAIKSPFSLILQSLSEEDGVRRSAERIEANGKFAIIVVKHRPTQLFGIAFFVCIQFSFKNAFAKSCMIFYRFEADAMEQLASTVNYVHVGSRGKGEAANTVCRKYKWSSTYTERARFIGYFCGFE